MSNPAALPLFGDAYLADTQHLTLEEHGAYLKLLLIAWRSPECTLPDDDKRIATMLGITAKKWATLRPAVMAFWTKTEHGWEQKRLSKERRFVAEKSANNSAAAKTRWKDKPLETNKTENANASANAHAGNDAPPPPSTQAKHSSGDTPPRDPPLLVDIMQIARWGAGFPQDLEFLDVWASLGADPDKDIIPTVTRVSQRLLGGGRNVPCRLSYFDRAIREDLQQRKATDDADVARFRRISETYPPNPAWEARQAAKAANGG